MKILIQDMEWVLHPRCWETCGAGEQWHGPSSLLWGEQRLLGGGGVVVMGWQLGPLWVAGAPWGVVALPRVLPALLCASPQGQRPGSGSSIGSLCATSQRTHSNPNREQQKKACSARCCSLQSPNYFTPTN